MPSRALVQAARLAPRSSRVARYRCTTDWSAVLGNSALSRLPSTITQTTGLAALQPHSNVWNLFVGSLAAEMIPPNPPSIPRTTVQSITIAPPVSTITCRTSVQMTASTPPRTV